MGGSLILANAFIFKVGLIGFFVSGTVVTFFWPSFWTFIRTFSWTSFWTFVWKFSFGFLKMRSLSWGFYPDFLTKILMHYLIYVTIIIQTVFPWGNSPGW